MIGLQQTQKTIQFNLNNGIKRPHSTQSSAKILVSRCPGNRPQNVSLNIKSKLTRIGLPRSLFLRVTGNCIEALLIDCLNLLVVDAVERDAKTKPILEVIGRQKMPALTEGYGGPSLVNRNK